MTNRPAWDPTKTLHTIARREDTVPRPVTREQLDALFGTIDLSTNTGVRDAAMLWLYYNGLRNTEVARLTTACVSYSAASESLVLKIVGKGEKFRLVVQHPTGAVVLGMHLLRTFAFGEWEAWVAEFAEEHPPQLAIFLAVERLLTRYLPLEPFPVFTQRPVLKASSRADLEQAWRQARPVSRRWSNKRFVEYRTKAQLPPSVGPHTLRHTFATNLLDNDVDLKTVSELLGHVSIRQTIGYTKVLETKKSRAVRQLYTPSGSVAQIDAAVTT